MYVYVLSWSIMCIHVQSCTFWRSRRFLSTSASGISNSFKSSLGASGAFVSSMTNSLSFVATKSSMNSAQLCGLLLVQRHIAFHDVGVTIFLIVLKGEVLICASQLVRSQKLLLGDAAACGHKLKWGGQKHVDSILQTSENGGIAMV